MLRLTANIWPMTTWHCWQGSRSGEHATLPLGDRPTWTFTSTFSSRTASLWPGQHSISLSKTFWLAILYGSAYLGVCERRLTVKNAAKATGAKWGGQTIKCSIVCAIHWWWWWCPWEGNSLQLIKYTLLIFATPWDGWVNKALAKSPPNINLYLFIADEQGSIGKLDYLHCHWLVIDYKSVIVLTCHALPDWLSVSVSCGYQYFSTSLRVVGNIWDISNVIDGNIWLAAATWTPPNNTNVIYIDACMERKDHLLIRQSIT